MIGLVVSHFIYTTAYRFHVITSPTKIYFDMHQVMSLNLFGFVVLSAIEDEVSRFHLFELKVYR